MKNSIIVPFDLNTARKIKSGEIEGSVLINNIEIEFVYESKDCAGPYNLLFVRKDEYGISAIYANTEGCALGDTTLELRVEAGAYFKEGDILTSTKGCQFIYDGLITEGAMGSICGMTTYGDLEFDRCTLWTDVYDRDKNRNVRKAIEEEKKFLAEKIIKAEEMAKPEVVTLKVCFDTYGLLYRPNTCVDVEIPFYDDKKIRDMLNKASADIMKWCDKNMVKYNKELKESRSTKKHCEGLRKHIANLERRLLKHALANVILSIISVAAIIALFTLIQN